MELPGMKRSTVDALDSLEALWSKVDLARREYAAVVRPAGSFSVEEYAARYGIPRETARTQLRKLMVSGKLAAHRVVCSDDSGIMRRCVVYTVA